MMKKSVALLLCAILLCMTTTSAMALNASGTAKSSSIYTTLTTSGTSTGRYWSMNITAGPTADHRVVFAVFSNGKIVSPRVVYSKPLSGRYIYSEGYQSGGLSVLLAARLDDRDEESGVTVSGTFTP